jgi:hypothetical protein
MLRRFVKRKDMRLRLIGFKLKMDTLIKYTDLMSFKGRMFHKNQQYY